MCRYCLDMKKYGGFGRLKKCCIHRQCTRMQPIAPQSSQSTVFHLPTVASSQKLILQSHMSQNKVPPLQPGFNIMLAQPTPFKPPNTGTHIDLPYVQPNLSRYTIIAGKFHKLVVTVPCTHSCICILNLHTHMHDNHNSLINNIFSFTHTM